MSKYYKLEEFRSLAVDALGKNDYMQVVKYLAKIIEKIGHYIIMPEWDIELERAHLLIDWTTCTIQDVASINSQFDYPCIDAVKYDLENLRKMIENTPNTPNL